MNSLLQSGITPKTSPEEAFKIKFLNGMNLILGFVMLLSIPTGFLFDNPYIIYSPVPIAGGYFIAYYLTRVHKKQASRLLTSLVFNLATFHFCLSTDPSLKINMLFFVAILLPYFLFPREEKKLRIGLTSLSIVFFFLSDLLPHYGPANPLTPQQTYFMSLVPEVLTFAFLLAVLFRILKEQEYIITNVKKKNDELKESDIIIQDSLAYSNTLMATLEDSKTRMDLALQASKIGVWEYGFLINELTWDKGMFDLFELDKEKFDGQFSTFKNHILKEDQILFIETMNKAIDEKTKFECEFRIKTANGNVRHIRLIAHLYFSENQELSQMLGACWNITEQKEQESLLVQTQDILRKTSEIARIGGWEYDLDNQEVFWSKEIRELCEVPEHFEPVIDSAVNFFHSSNRKQILEAMDQAINYGSPWDLELKMVTYRNRITWVRSIGVPFKEGGIVNRIQGVFQDINDQKSAQIEREFFFNLSSDLIGIFIANGETSYLNPAWHKTLGWPPDTLFESKMIDFIHPDDRETYQGNVKKLLDSNLGSISFQSRLRTKQGIFRWFAWNMSALRDQKKLYAVARDVSDQKKYERELISAKEEALQAAQAKSIFLSTMSHEIRTPMNAVIGMTELLLEEEPKEAQLENLNILKFSAKNLLALINDILDYNKIESGQIQFEKVPFRLTEIVKNIESSFTKRVKEQNSTLKTQLSEKLPEILLGDSTRLVQVLNNLVGNAVKFTEDGLVSLEIHEKRIDQERLLLEIRVRDTGIGIAKDKLDTIFVNFSQADPTINRRFGGTGLGLSICKKLVELQGGKIWVESELGVGSIFYVHVPFDIDQNTAKHQQVLQEENPWPDGFFEGKRILVTDDNHINFILAKKILVKKGCLVTEAGNGKEALIELQKNPYDMVLMDIQMPIMDGYQATKAIRNLKDSEVTNIPIIALTADVLEDVKLKVENAGMNDYASKPLSPKILFQKMFELLNQNESSP